MFWAAETFLLLWLANKSKIKTIGGASIAVMLLMVFSLSIDWIQLYFNPSANADILPVILNKIFITGIIAIASLIATIIILRKENNIIAGISLKTYSGILGVITLLFIYLVPLFELNYQLIRYVDFESVRIVILGTYNLLYISLLMLYFEKENKTLYRVISIILGLLGSLAYLTYYNSEFIYVRNAYLQGDAAINGGYIVFHYLSIILVIGLTFLCLKNIKKFFVISPIPAKLGLWYLIFIIVFVASTELVSFILLSIQPGEENFYTFAEQIQKIGFPILWGVTSLILMYIGMKKKHKDLRIISLTLFTITLVKLFAVDVWEMSEGGKVAAFISLGVFLLIVSFMYQKLKKIIL
jgi:uncharacterized membrane protein